MLGRVVGNQAWPCVVLITRRDSRTARNVRASLPEPGDECFRGAGEIEARTMAAIRLMFARFDFRFVTGGVACNSRAFRLAVEIACAQEGFC